MKNKLSGFLSILSFIITVVMKPFRGLLNEVMKMFRKEEKIFIDIVAWRRNKHVSRRSKRVLTKHDS